MWFLARTLTAARRRHALDMATLLLGSALAAPFALAQPVPTPFPGPLTATVTVDPAFSPALNPGARVRALARQTDGKLVIAGSFTQVGGVPRPGLARLNIDGSLDAAFDPGPGADGPVLALAAQPDGKLLIGGQFTHVNGAVATQLARLNANGSLDTGFRVSGLQPIVGDRVNAIVLQPDGKVVVGGTFTYRAPTRRLPRVVRRGLLRLLGGGTRDTNFSATLDPSSNDYVSALALQADGRLLAGGRFAQVNGGVERRLLARFEADGSVDAGFRAAAYAALDPWQTGVKLIALQADGKMVVVRDSYSVAPNGSWAGMDTMLRLLGDGGTDTGFPQRWFWWTADALAPGAHGEILVGGSFGGIDTGTSAHPHLAWLSPGGADISDSVKLPVPDDAVLAIVAEPDGWVIGGAFSHLDGAARTGIARLQYQTGVRIPVTIGQCGPANGVPVARGTLPAADRLCSAGTASPIWGARTKDSAVLGWRCQGIYSAADCSAPELP